MPYSLVRRVAPGRSKISDTNDQIVLIGQTSDQKANQIQVLVELLAILRGTVIQTADEAVFHLLDAKEEMKKENSDVLLVDKYLKRARTTLSMVNEDTSVYKKSKELFDIFGITIQLNA